MAQVLKYWGGGNAPKPIKVGDNYYTATLLKSDLYGDKLDEYIKFKDFNLQQEAEFRKNLDSQVDALISGRLSLLGNTLVDSLGEWKNTGMYAKPKFLGSLNEEQKANNASLDVANYLVRALNSGRIMTYISPQKYTKENSKLFLGLDNYLNSENWTKSELSDRYTKLAGLFDEEINRLKNNKAYRDSYSYEGWQNVEWDKRADNAIKNLTEASKILKDTTKSDSDKLFELAKLGYDISDYLVKEEEKKEEEKKGGNGNGNGNGNGGNSGNQNGPQQVVTNIVNGFNPVDPFNFADPILYYNGTPYTYGTPEYLNLLKDRNNLYNEEMSLLDYVTSEINLLGKIDRNFATFLSVPEYYKYYSNVTPNFKESTNIKAAYLLRPDALSSKGSILRIVDNNNRINDYIIDANKGRLYLTDQDKTGLYKKRIVGGEELFKAFSDNGIVLNRLESPSLDLGEGIGTTNEIFRSIEANNPTPLKYIEQLVNYIDNNKELINKHGSGSLRGQYLGSINKILGLNRKGQIKNIVTYSSDKKTIEINSGDKTLYIKLKTPHNDVSRDIHINNVEKIYVNKEGGVLKAQAGIKTLKLTSTSTTSEELPENQLSTSLRGKKTLSKATNAALEATSKEGAFSSTDSARLNLALLDVGSAVAGVLPGLSAVSAVTGAASSVGTAIADYVDVYNNKMGFWDATKNLGMSLGLDAVSLLPGMKSLKVAKGLKVIAHILPRAMGFFWAKGLITDENQKKALLETGTKLSNGDFSKLNTLDFLNIATLIRMTTLGARDTNTVRKKAFGSGKKENVVISGKVDGTPISKTIEGDAAKDVLGRRFWGMNPKYKAKAKKALTEEANSNESTRQTDAEGKSIDWTEKNIKDFKIETKPVEGEIDGPKAIFENFLGLGNKGFNVPVFSDKWIAQRWLPKYHYGMVTEDDVHEMRTNTENENYDNLLKYFSKDINGKPISDKQIRNWMNDKSYKDRLNEARRIKKKSDLEAGRVDFSKVTILDINKYAHKIISEARNWNHVSTQKSSDLILNALKKLEGNEKFDLLQFKLDLLWGINNSLTTGLYGTLRFDKFGNVVPRNKQGGRIELGLQLIKSYKSGGYLIPKFLNSGLVNYLYDPNKYYLDNITNYNTTTIPDLNKVFIKQNTPSLSGRAEGLTDVDKTASNITYQSGVNKLKDFISSGNFVSDINNYLKNNSVKDYNSNISKLRELRAKFEKENYKYKNDAVKKYNELFHLIFPEYNKYSSKLNDIYGGATNQRHVISFANTEDLKDRRRFNIGGVDYWLDNAGYLRTGEYGVLKVSNIGDSNPDGTPKLGDGTTDLTKDAKAQSLVDQLAGSVEHITNLTKKNTRINTPRMLALLEAFTSIKANNDATDELLKIRPVSEDPIYRLRFRYGNYPAISLALLTNAKINTLASTPLTSDLGTYLAAKQSAYAKMAPNSLAAALANYEADLKSRLAIQEAEEANTASQITTANTNRNRAINNENYKNWLESQRISSNANVLKTFLSETRNYMNENDKMMKGLLYEKEAEAAYKNYTNSVLKMQDDLVNLIVNSNAVSKTDASGNVKTDSLILQEYFLKNPDDKAKFATRRQDLESKYREALRKAMESKKINLGLWDTDVTSYTYKLGGAVNEKIKVLKIKDANAARRLDSKESIKAITKDKEEFGKNYRTMSAGALKLLDKATT